jgi:ABC-type amino acid transport substrate-binding protein
MAALQSGQIDFALGALPNPLPAGVLHSESASRPYSSSPTRIVQGALLSSSSPTRSVFPCIVSAPRAADGSAAERPDRFCAGRAAEPAAGGRAAQRKLVADAHRPGRVTLLQQPDAQRFSLHRIGAVDRLMAALQSGQIDFALGALPNPLPAGVLHSESWFSSSSPTRIVQGALLSSSSPTRSVFPCIVSAPLTGRS